MPSQVSATLACGIWMIAVAPLLAQTKSTPAEPIIERAAVYMGEKLLDKLVIAGANRVIEAGWNASFGSPAERVGELDRRLAGYHGLLTQLAKDQSALAAGADQFRSAVVDQAARVENLRKGLTEKTSAADVRRIVDNSLTLLRDRVSRLEAVVGTLEKRADQLDDRLRRIEDLFGRIPYVTPTPLLHSSNPTAPPSAHPLTLAWLKLLVRSEQSREKLVDLRRLYPDTSSKMKEPLAADAIILAETSALRDKVRRELDLQFAERQAMLKEHLPTSPTMIEYDDRLSAVFWLMAVTTPVDGRLGVPPDLLGPQASEMMTASIWKTLPLAS